MKRVTFGVIAALSVCDAQVSLAQTFDCAGAKGAVETAICSDPAAKRADDEMSAAFGRLKGALASADAASLLAGQRAWLKRRNVRCLDDPNKPGCFRRENEARVAALNAKPAAGPGTPQPLTPVIAFRPASKRAAGLDVFLFRFADAKTPAEKALNAAVDRMVADVRREAGDDGGEDASNFDHERWAKIAYASDRLLSLAVETWDFTGGAHGMSTTSAINVDMRAGRALAMDDLVSNDKRAPLVATCEAQIARQIRDKMVEGGENPQTSEDARKEEKQLQTDAAKGVAEVTPDLKNWTFGQSRATVTYDPYSVGPYAMGAFTCDVPYETLRPLAKADFPLP